MEKKSYAAQRGYFVEMIYETVPELLAARAALSAACQQPDRAVWVAASAQHNAAILAAWEYADAVAAMIRERFELSPRG